MARIALNTKTRYATKKVAAEVNKHKVSLDALEAGTYVTQRIFTGKNGTGACTLTGALVGDKVAGKIVNATDLTDDTANFETTITVADQIQQSSASNLSAKKFLITLVTPK